jgi:MFS family permease
MLTRIFSLLLGTGILLVGAGFLFTLLGVRAGLEGFSNKTVGVIMSSYFLGFVIGSWLCPIIIRRAGHVRAFAAMASIASTMALFHVLMVGPISWSLFRVVMGVCLVGLYMVIESWLNTLATNETRGRIFGTYMMVTLVTMALGQYLILVGDVKSFAPFGVVSILISLALVPITLTRVVEPTPVQTPRLDPARLYRSSPLGAAGAFASGLLNSAFMGMGAIYAFRAGFSQTDTATFVGMTILGGALLQWPVGHLSDRRDRRTVIIMVSLVAAGVAFLLSTLAQVSHAVFIIVAFLYGGLAFSIYGLSVAHINDFLQPEEVLDATSALLLVHGVGASIGPALAGVLMDAFGPRSLFYYLALILLALGLFGYARRLAGSETARRTDFIPMGTSSTAALEMDPRGAPAPEEQPR